MNNVSDNSTLWSANKTKEVIVKIPQWLPNDISYWVAAALTGLAAVSYAAIVKYAEDYSRQIFSLHPYSLLLFSPICFILGWWVVYRYSPQAKGSGIPQVMAAIESLGQNHGRNLELEKLLSLKTAAFKVLSSLLCVLGGGAVGREGPTIQISASIFNFVNRKSDQYIHKTNQQFGLIAGGAAGIAAAFNTPLGGLVYAIEELATLHFSKFRTSLISGVIVSGLVSQWLLGSYLYLGYPKLSTITAEMVVLCSIVGATTGGFGALFGKILFAATKRLRSTKNVTELMVFAGACGIILAVGAIVVDDRALGPGREIVIQLLFKNGAGSDLKLAIVRFLGPLVSYLSGCAGGIFAPALASGATIGALLGNLFNYPGENIFILVGMIGFLTGVTHSPFTSFVLVLEMTDRHTAILPMMLASLFASIVAKFIQDHSFYEQVKVFYSAQLESSEALTP